MKTDGQEFSLPVPEVGLDATTLSRSCPRMYLTSVSYIGTCGKQLTNLATRDILRYNMLLAIDL